MLESTGRPRFLPFAATATPLLHQHHILESGEVNIKNPCELATIEQVSQGRRLRSENAWTETHTHVVIVHLVLIVPTYHLCLQEHHQVYQNLLVQGRQLVQEI
jgi:hypothetical protein